MRFIAALSLVIAVSCNAGLYETVAVHSAISPHFLEIDGDSIAGCYPAARSYMDTGPTGNTVTELGRAMDLYLHCGLTSSNYGFSGALMSFSIAVATVNPKTFDRKPQAAFFHTGINDIAGGATWTGSTAQTFSNLWIICQSSNPPIDLFIDEVWPWNGASAAMSAIITNWNLRLNLFGSTNPGVKIVQTHDAMATVRSGTSELWDLNPTYTDDGQHPDATGRCVAYWKRLLANAMFEYYKTRQVTATTGNIGVVQRAQ